MTWNLPVLPTARPVFGSSLTGECSVLVSTWVGGLALKYKCPEEREWRQHRHSIRALGTVGFSGCRLSLSTGGTQHEAPGGWQAHLRLNLAAGVQAGVLVGIGTGCGGQGFGWLFPGHPGFPSTSELIWSLMPTTGFLLFYTHFEI